MSPEGAAPTRSAQRELAKLLAAFLSRSHPAELERFRASSGNSDGPDIFRIDEGSIWVVPAYRFHIFCNAALNYINRSPEVRYRVRQNPQFAAWVQDVLYYPIQSWMLGEVPQLESYDLVEALEAQLGIDAADVRNKEGIIGGKILSKTDVEFLLRQAVKLCAYLKEPSTLIRNLAQRFVEVQSADGESKQTQAALELLATLLQRPLLASKKKEGENNGHLTWEFDYWGNPAEALPHRRYLEEIRTSNINSLVASLYAREAQFALQLERLGSLTPTKLSAIYAEVYGEAIGPNLHVSCPKAILGLLAGDEKLALDCWKKLHLHATIKLMTNDPRRSRLFLAMVDPLYPENSAIDDDAHIKRKERLAALAPNENTNGALAWVDYVASNGSPLVILRGLKLHQSG